MPGERRKAATFKMRPHAERIVEAVLHLVNVAAAAGSAPTQYEIAKSLFLADRNHLNKYGRPITYDNYVAMEHGPVPSFSYDLLRENHRALDVTGQDMPWVRSAAPEKGEKRFAYHSPSRLASEDVLSPSDMRELESAFTIVSSLGFAQIRKLTHEDQAYVDAWEEDGPHKQFPMSYTLLFDPPNEDLAREIAFISHHL
ncbi:MAG: Panacea domain-containing protein [Inquilinus sp.]|uniref:Panacea domain-containing protein n=1 Tax=Inquilinus sp. TaxID=1932117 RepID=UPI003F39E236